MLQEDKFPFDFIWGTAISSAQAEGMPQADGAGYSIWDSFALKKGKIKNNHTNQVSCNFYENYNNDIEILRKLEIPNFRFSIAWNRVYPVGYGHVNHPGLDFYKKLIDKCLENNIRPWVTLYHWDLPKLLEDKGGWTNRSIVSWFREYALTLAMHLGDRVKDWIILNEPLTFTGAGYFLGIHAPGRTGLGNFLPAMHHATLCQAEGARIIRSELKNSNIGTTFSLTHVQPVSEKQNDINASNRIHALLNRLYLEPALGYGYPIKELPFLSKVEKYIKQGDEKRMEFDFDFIGVQNYTREIVKSNWLTPYIGARIVPAKDREVELTAMGWEIFPTALYNTLKFVSGYEKINSIIVSENGVAFDEPSQYENYTDKNRIEFLKQNIAQLLKAVKEFEKIKGYFVWSFLDNFEWAEGYHPRFGLVHVDFKTQKRTVKQSGYWYRKFILEQLRKSMVSK